MNIPLDPNYANLPSPPFVPVNGIPNFRDLGGYPTASPTTHSIRQNIVYRCGDPTRVTPDGIATIKKLGITHVYDLRSNNEIKKMGRDIVTWDGCERVFVPVFTDEDYSPQNLALRYQDYAAKGTEGFARAYTDLLIAGGPTSFNTILLHIANEPEKPLIIHCTAGKDRTGIICALILSVCGVEDDVIAHEYALTELGLPEAWKGHVIKHLIGNPGLKGDTEGARNMISARHENMIRTLEVIRDKFGGAENYIIKNCGLTKEKVERIRQNLVVEQPAVHKIQYNLEIDAKHD